MIIFKLKLQKFLLFQLEILIILTGTAVFESFEQTV
jgi:hypothetical protein